MPVEIPSPPDRLPEVLQRYSGTPASRLIAQPQKNVPTRRMFSVVRLKHTRRRVRREVHTDAGLRVMKHPDVARVADGVRADPKRAAGRAVERRLERRLTGEQLVFVHQLRTAGNKIL